MVDPESALPRSLSLPPDVDTLAGRLRLVIDPELGVNIVDLGLVYRAEVVDGVAHVLMTTTTPACPIGSFLSDQVRWALLGVDGHGSSDEPQYEIKSDTTDHIAMHKGSALTKLRT